MKQRQFRILSSFKSMSAPRLRDRKNEVVSRMTGNPNFKETASLVEELAKTGDEWDAVSIAVKTGEKTLVAKRDALQEKVTVLMYQLFNQVVFLGNNDAEKLITSGFEVEKQPSQAKASAPTGLKLKDGSVPASIEARVKRVKGAKNYRFEWTTDPVTDTSKWESAQKAFVKFTITNLTPATVYWVRVAAIDKEGVEYYCDPVARVAQF